MTPLWALWWVSLAIAGAALLITLMLVLARALFGWRGRAREQERKRLVPLLLSNESDADARPDLWLADDFIAELMVELIQLVRGRERERFIARAADLGVPERLRHHLGSASARVRQQAAEALGLFADDRSVARLQGALDDANPDVRLTAALALAEAGRAPPLRQLVRRLDIGRSEKSLLVTALFKELAAHQPAELAEAVADPAAPATARIAAAEALAQSGRYDVVPVITRAALEAPEGAAELPRYLRALGAFGHPAAAAAVEKGLTSDDAQVRAAAAEAAGRIGMTALAPSLASLLADSSWTVRYRAGEALVRLGAKGRATLQEAASGADTAAAAARRILAEERLA